MPRDRVEDDGRSDVRDNQQELQERPQVDLVVLAAAGDVRRRIVEHRLEESGRRDRRDERDDEQHSEYPGIALVSATPRLPPISRDPGIESTMRRPYNRESTLGKTLYRAAEGDRRYPYEPRTTASRGRHRAPVLSGSSSCFPVRLNGQAGSQVKLVEGLRSGTRD